mmetsp:Transcript_109073/g.314168  ORF Transcript_109073/g.314168 Transcript_109073/m.314168 type:complete len:368 (+) Transcript_109073:90-1193(+)
MSSDNLDTLEDLARRYDTQVLREYLLEQEEQREALGPRPGNSGSFAGDDQAAQGPPWSEIHEMRPKCFRRLRWLLFLNFFVYWATVAYGGYSCHLRVLEQGLRALPPLETGLLGVFVLGTQGTLEFAASAVLTRPARAADALGTGFRCWDGAAWLTGLGARTAVLLDVLCLPIIHRGSALLFLLSAGTFAFAIGTFVLCVQMRLLCGLFCSGDHFSYDKPDLFFKGRDALGMCDSAPIAALPPALLDEEEEEVDAIRFERAPPVNTIKVANFAHFSDLGMLHSVVTRLYIPVSCQETQEFIKSASNFSRCFCEDVVQCSVKFFFLMDYALNPLVLLSLFVSASQAIGACFYASTASMDLRSTDDLEL